MQTEQKYSGFWDKIARKYSNQPIRDQESYETKLELTRKVLKPTDEVLEIGCGTGGTARLHSPYVKHITAADFSAEMIQIADERTREEKLDNVTNVQAVLADFDPKQKKFDVVVAMNILNLLPNVEKDIQSIYRLTKPGGAFISSTTCLSDIPFYVYFPIRYVVAPLGLLIDKIPPVQFFSQEELKGMLQSAGFTVESIWTPEQKMKASFIVARKPE